MDKSKLPLSLLVALGLAPAGCTTKDPSVHACLNVAPADDGNPPPEDPPTHPCLDQPPDEVGPCLEVAEPDPQPCLKVAEPDPGPCLDVAEPPPKVEPCLEPPVGPCLRVAPPKDRGKKGKRSKKSDGGMASAGSRAEVIERLRGTLPADVADRLFGDEEA